MKRFLLFALAAVMFAACTKDAIDEQSGIQPIVDEAPETLTVSFESDDETRIQLNEQTKTVWTKDDLVSVFYKSDANQKWIFQGETGTRTAELRCLDAGKSTTKTTRVVVVYPYNESYDFNSETYNICTQLPATQHYLANSYGLDGNLMVSSGEYNQFSLKSVYGWLKLQITGNGEKVRVINFRGNNAEQVAGETYIYTEDASMSLAADMLDPDNDYNVGGSLVFDDTILTKLILDCGSEGGVELGAEPTMFFIALPPQTFAEGFTVDIKTTDGQMMHKSYNKEFVIERNTIQPMTAFAYECNGGNGLYIPDEVLKAYLVDNYDFDFDGEISIEEAEYIDQVSCANKGVEDLTGLESCPNLVTLNCSNNNIKVIELPNLTELKTVTCDGNPIEKLNFDNCIKLANLNLQSVTTNALKDNATAISIDGYTQATTFYFTAKNTPITSFTFKNTTDVDKLEFYGSFVNVDISNNQALQLVDVSTLEYLETLDAQKCKLMSLDVTQNTALKTLVCNNNALTALNVSKNTDLVKFYCHDNQLSKILVTANAALEEFDVSDNLLSTINVRKNPALKYLNVNNNAELSMVDVQENTELECLCASGLAITDIELTANTKLKVAELLDKNLTVINKLDTTGLGIVYVEKTPYTNGKMLSISETSGNWDTVKSWCSNYGTGWYLPSKDELLEISGYYSAINSTLSKYGKTTLEDDYYWSSTLYSTSYDYYCVRLSSGYRDYENKKYSFRARAICRF